MSSNTEVIVLKDFAGSPPAKSLRRRKPWSREDQEVTQKHRQALLDQIRSGRDHKSRRSRSRSPVAFGKSKTLNRQFSKSANDVKGVVAELVGLAKLGSRKLTLSQINLRAKDDNFEVRFTKEGDGCSKTRSLCDLSEHPGEDCKFVELHPKSSKPKTSTLTPKIPEIAKVPESNDVEETKLKSPNPVLLGKRLFNREQSKSAIDVRKPGGGHFGLKVIGSQQPALSQIWTVPTNCGCCEHGKDDTCKRLKVEELRQKFSKKDVSPAKQRKVEEDVNPKPVALTTTEEEDDDDSYAIVKMLSWMGRMLIKNPKPKLKWVVLQVPVVPREGTAKDASSGTANKTSQLYLNVIVEAGSGLISITPVASFEELIKTIAVVKKEKQEVERPTCMSTLGHFPLFI